MYVSVSASVCCPFHLFFPLYLIAFIRFMHTLSLPYRIHLPFIAVFSIHPIRFDSFKIQSFVWNEKEVEIEVIDLNCKKILEIEILSDKFILALELYTIHSTHTHTQININITYHWVHSFKLSVKQYSSASARTRVMCATDSSVPKKKILVSNGPDQNESGYSYLIFDHE